jgi:hypothetical protein
MKRTFNVAADLMPEFSELISDNELANELIGRTEDDEIIVEVNYRSNQKGEILELVDWLEENNYPTEETETETEED